MSRMWITRGLMAVGLMGALVWSAQASYPEFEDVQALDGDHSPTRSESNINNYIYQDEQINVTPEDGLVKVLRTDQKILVNDYVTAVFPIKHAIPREMRNVMREVTKLEGGRAEVIRDKKTGDNFIQLIAPRYMIPYLKDAVEALDVSYLKEYWDGSGDVYVKMQHRRAAFVDTIARNYAGSQGFSTIDTTNNALRRFDEEYRNKKYIEAVNLVDVPPHQVELDVKFYEVAASNDMKLGVDYVAWANGPGRSLFSFAEAGYSASQRAKGYTSWYDPFLDARIFVSPNEKVQVLDTAANASYRAVNYLLPSSYVDFLQVKGKARLINSQNITVVSSDTGIISTQDHVLAFVNNDNDLDTVRPGRSPAFILRDNDGDFVFADTNNNGVYDEGENKLNENGAGFVVVPDSNRRLNYESAGTVGMRLEVTPYVGLESMELEIDLEIGDMNGYAPNGKPIINARTVHTTVRLMDGQPYVIASLKRVHDIDSSGKAPGLGSIPVLGYLFGGEQSIKRDNDIMIVITPKFYLSSQINIATPPRVDTLELMIDRQVPVEMPENKLGYDMWLLDS